MEPRAPTILTPEALRGPQEFAGNPDAWGRLVVDPHARRNLLGYSHPMREARADIRGLSERAQHSDVAFMRLRAVAHGMAFSEMPPGLYGTASGGHRLDSTDFLSRLGAIGPNGQPLVDDKALYAVMEWSNRRLSDKQRHFEQNVLPERLQSFADRVEAAVQKKWLPPTASRNLHRVLGAKVYLDDGLYTTARGRDGVHTLAGRPHPNQDRIVIYQGAGSHTLDHEFAHGLSGRDTLPEDAYVRKENAGLNRIFGRGEGGTQLEEAVNEHVTDVLARGNVHKTNPSSRHRGEDAAYPQGRGLLHALCTKGVRKVDVRLFIAAQMEDSADRDAKEAAGQESDATKLVNALHEAFPKEDVVATISSSDFKEAHLVQHVRRISRQHAAPRIGAALLGRRRSRT